MPATLRALRHRNFQLFFSGQLISLIEINIGKDLQYIRFNGSLIGGLAGLGLYTGEFVLRWL